jgi:hypothetical protein
MFGSLKSAVKWIAAKLTRAQPSANEEVPIPVDVPAPEPVPQPAPAPEVAPAAPALSPLMQRVAEIQGVQTMEAYLQKRLFRNAFHETGHAFVAHANGEEVTIISVNNKQNRPHAVFTNKTTQKLESLIAQGFAGTDNIKGVLLVWVTIAVAGQMQDTEADHERKRPSTQLDWSKNPGSGATEDSDRIIRMMKRAGFDGQSELVKQAEDKARATINEKRAHYEAAVTYLLDVGNLEQPKLNDDFLNG